MYHNYNSHITDEWTEAKGAKYVEGFILFVISYQ